MSIILEMPADQGLARATDAIVFYKAGDRSFATQHPIENGQIMPGKAVDIRRLAHGLMKRQGEATIEIVHERVIVQQPGVLAWWRPAQATKLSFHNKGQKKVWLPALLFTVHDGRMSVWACGDKGRPTAATQLYHAPFYNLYDRGDLCMGTMPKGRDIDSWEASFFGSKFTHPHHNPPGYAAYFFAKREYPCRNLKKAGKTVEQFFGGLK